MPFCLSIRPTRTDCRKAGAVIYGERIMVVASECPLSDKSVVNERAGNIGIWSGRAG